MIQLWLQTNGYAYSKDVTVIFEVIPKIGMELPLSPVEKKEEEEKPDEKQKEEDKTAQNSIRDKDKPSSDPLPQNAQANGSAATIAEPKQEETTHLPLVQEEAKEDQAF